MQGLDTSLCSTMTTLQEQYAVGESKMWIALPDGGIMAEEDFKKG